MVEDEDEVVAAVSELLVALDGILLDVVVTDAGIVGVAPESLDVEVWVADLRLDDVSLLCPFAIVNWGVKFILLSLSNIWIV